MRVLSAALGLLIRRRGLLGISGLAALAIYGVYALVLRSGVVAPLTPQASFGVISDIVKYTFIFAITAVTLSLAAYLLPRIVPSLSLQLSADASVDVARRMINVSAALCVIGLAFGAVAYTLPKILPASVFEPIAKVEYSLAIARMFDPFKQGGVAAIMDKIEPFPGFPYYSRESDHPSVWPLRVTRDRMALAQSYRDVMAKYDLINKAGNIQRDIKLLGASNRGGQAAAMEALSNFRNWYYSRLGGDSKALVDRVGRDAAAAFLKVEQQRADLREDFPNRFALLRLKNTGKVDAREITIEMDIYGELYDYAISSDADHTHGATYDRSSRRIIIDRMSPSYVVEIRLWYNYLSLDQRVFPDKKDVINEVTQGFVINNITVSGGKTQYTPDLLNGFEAYDRLYFGSARKEDFEKDERVFLERRDAQMAAWTKKQEQEHPSLKNVSPDTLAASTRPDSAVNAVWVTFKSDAGKSYTAVHVFKAGNGSYILLSSGDKNRDDFIRVRTLLATTYDGTAENKITDRGNDITDTIRVKSPFTQKAVAEKVKTWFQPTFKDATIAAVYY